MKNLLTQTLSAAALTIALASTAHAGNVVNPVYQIPQIGEVGTTQIFDAGSDAAGDIGSKGDEFFNYGIAFLQPPTSFLSLALSSDNGSVTFDKIEIALFDPTAPDLLGTPVYSGDCLSLSQLSCTWSGAASVAGSALVLFVEGTVLGDDASYSGELDITLGDAPTTPVPEPETWALMLAGLGVIGGVARRRRAR